MAGLRGDEAMHGLADSAIRRMPLGRGAELDHVHRLARVDLQVVAHAVRNAHRVGRYLDEPRGGEGLVELPGLLYHPAPVGQRSHRVDLLGRHLTVPRGQWLPLEGEESVALQIAEGAVVAEHVEAIRGALEGAPRLVASIS